MVAKSTETPKGRVPKGMEAPASKADAHRLLENLGYKGHTVWRIEDDRILASGIEGAFTVYLEFDDDAGIVRIKTWGGWPV